MSSLPHTSAGLKEETPSTSETAVGGSSGGNLVSNSSTQPEKPQIGSSASKPGSAEEAADKLYEERMEEEYAKREGGA